MEACYTEKTDKLTANADETYISKYIDVYNSYNSSKFGDVVFEASFNSSDSNSWFSDYSLFVNSNSPVLIRGGNYGVGSIDGLFYFDVYNDNNFDDGGFRPVCVVK